MESIDILGDYGPENPPPFQLGQRSMAVIWTSVPKHHALPVKVKKFLRMAHEEAMGGHLLRPEPLMKGGTVYAPSPTKIRDS